MKRKFDFGCIDFENRGQARNRVTVEMEYKEEKGKKCFSVSAMVWNVRRSDCICGGQCLDTIAPIYGKPYFFRNIEIVESVPLKRYAPRM